MFGFSICIYRAYILDLLRSHHNALDHIIFLSHMFCTGNDPTSNSFATNFGQFFISLVNLVSEVEIREPTRQIGTRPKFLLVEQRITAMGMFSVKRISSISDLTARVRIKLKAIPNAN